MSKKPIDKRTERLIRQTKNRGGRASQIITDKTKYDRKRDKQIVKDEIDSGGEN